MPEDLARVTEWERLAEASTPGPWCAFNGAINSWKQDERGEAIVGCMGEVVIGCGRVDCAKPRMADAAFIAAARAAVPEMARMLREALDAVGESLRLGDGDLAEIAMLVDERDKWREVAASWEARAHEAMRLADVAAAELKRMRETHSPKSVEEVFRDAKLRLCKHLRCEAGSGNCLDCGTPRPVNGWNEDALPGRDRHGDIVAEGTCKPR